MLLYARHSWTICLSNVDPQANAIVLIPISAMMMVKITVLAPILAPVVISITRLRLGGSSPPGKRKRERPLPTAFRGYAAIFYFSYPQDNGFYEPL